jgi:hypothetical protein
MNEFIEYTISVDDWAAYGEYQASTLDAMKRQVRLIQLIGTLVVASAALATFFLLDSWIWVFSVIVGGTYAIWDMPRSMRKQARKQMVKLFNEGKNASARGVHRLEATPGGLAASSEVSESLTRWDAIERLDENDTHAFFSFGGGLGAAVPRNSVTAGNFDALMAQVRRYMHDARGIGAAS